MMVSKIVGERLAPKSYNDDIVVVKFKFKNDDKFTVKTVTMDVYEELKNAPLIEYCEIVS